jgi:serine protease
MPRKPLIAAITAAALATALAALATALPGPGAAHAQDRAPGQLAVPGDGAPGQDVAPEASVPGQVVVQYDPGVGPGERAAVQASTGTAPAPAAATPAPNAQVLQVPAGASVGRTIRRLRAIPGIRYAVPNVLAHAAGYFPNDPGRDGPGGWKAVQWNFLAAAGIDAPDAWSNLIAAGRPGGSGVVIAVLDTGVAYENRVRFRRSPDFSARQFVRGYDFVDHTAHPDDQNGHGTFVAGVIGEQVNNGVALTGIAYGAKLMPLRVLDEQGLGDAATIAAGIRYAARHGAQIVNLSLEFDSSVPGSQIPEVLSAIRYASRRGVLVVGAAGNEALGVVAYPARADGALSVGATTEHLCEADYSNDGRSLDLVAPGGGADAALPDDPHCRPAARPGRDIFALTFTGSSFRRFGLPGGYEGTSMAAPHVAAVAALVIASGVIGAHPSPQALIQRLESTAQSLVGPPGFNTHYGWGLVDAARATAPTPAQAAAWRRAAAARRRAAARRH